MKKMREVLDEIFKCTVWCIKIKYKEMWIKLTKKVILYSYIFIFIFKCEEINFFKYFYFYF